MISFDKASERYLDLSTIVLVASGTVIIVHILTKNIEMYKIAENLTLSLLLYTMIMFGRVKGGVYGDR